ncbi:probable WRKY transcription factor 53 [Salvia miltiorrhiza]|uniref:probable WRKY transcription factor 53 n=1 Tax=Salvia miltiorrhiza TaxID=226208 RepID=UPI0025AD541C|nr:probable WRKY transcription factor 53 [Salvia miltiorrhiza]
MEKVGVSEKKTVITVLTEGKKLANELKRQLHPTKNPTEACDVLVESILSSYENAITLLALIENGGFEPSISIEGSPRSEGSDHNSKKRKTMPRWSEHVRISSGAGGEAQLDDGYNWRKYGQKEILGATHPRAYYRCTHRNTQGCLATKQVQRADEDPTVFEVIYRGKHSCRQERLRQSKERKEQESLACSTLVSNGPSLIKTEKRDVIDSKDEEDLPSFSFPSTPIECENVEPQFFSEPNRFITMSYSPSSFLSSATSESYFSPSPCLVNDFGFGNSLQSSESDFGEIISNPTPITDFSLGDLDISIDEVDFESHFLDEFF